MDLVITLIFGILALILIFIGLLHRDTFFIIPAGIIFILFGAIMFSQGIAYKTGEVRSINPSDNSTIVQDTYSTFKGGFYADYGLSYLVFFLGIYCFYLPLEWTNQRRKARKSERTYSEEE